MTETKVLLVTGGSRGIGAATVRMAAAAGFAVCFTYIEHEERALELVREVEAAAGRALSVRADAGCGELAAEVFERTESSLGPVVALVNNVGITGGIGAFEHTTLETMRRVFEVNVLGTMAFSQEAIRRWRRSGCHGTIVNISSVAATLGSAHEYVHYAASKAAVEGFTVGLAKEVAADGIRVNAVSPGTTLTEIHAAGGDPGRPARVAAKIPMGRAGEPQEIAEAIMWLLSEKSSYVTGSVLRVAGGL